MKRRKIEIKIMSPLLGTKVQLPEYATPGSAAMDLRACLDRPLDVEPGETVMIPSGIAISIADKGLVALLAPRSGLGIQHGIVLANTIGVIDSDYHGEIGVGIRNQGNTRYTIEPGERICQMLFVPVEQVQLQIVNQFAAKSERGSGGFGHSGRH